MNVRQRQPRVECPAFLAFVRRRSCCACGRAPKSQAAHLRFTDPRYPQKRAVGIGEKSSDRWAVPLCASCHLDDPDAQHKGSEEAFWSRVGVDPFKLAIELYAEFGPSTARRSRRRSSRDRRRRPRGSLPFIEPNLEARNGSGRAVRSPPAASSTTGDRHDAGR